MSSSFLRVILIGFVSAVLYGCPLNMEVFFPKLKFRNDSDRKIKIFINLAYPDSSLKRSGGDKYIEPKSETYVGDFHQLERMEGVTLFVFDHGYFKSRWHEGVGTPDTYLEEDQILKKYYLSKEELDSLAWRLVYP